MRPNTRLATIIIIIIAAIASSSCSQSATPPTRNPCVIGADPSMGCLEVDLSQSPHYGQKDISPERVVTERMTMHLSPLEAGITVLREHHATTWNNVGWGPDSLTFPEERNLPENSRFQAENPRPIMTSLAAIPGSYQLDDIGILGIDSIQLPVGSYLDCYAITKFDSIQCAEIEITSQQNTHYEYDLLG